MSKLKVDGLKAGYDPQLKTPTHDKLCLEYANKENNLKIFYQIKNNGKLRIYAKGRLTHLMNTYLSKKETEYFFNGKTEEIPTSIPEYPNYLLTGKITKLETHYELVEYNDTIFRVDNWEHPIKARSFLIGVIDFKTDFFIKRIFKVKKIYNEFISQEIQLNREHYKGKGIDFNSSGYNSDRELAQKQEFIITNKLEEEETLTIEQPMLCIYSEIKPSIDSIGEVMRQIKIYNDYIGHPILRFEEQYTNKIQEKNIALVTYGEEHRTLFEEQGFIYINMGDPPQQPKQNLMDWVGESK